MSVTVLLFADLPSTVEDPKRPLRGMGSPGEVRLRISASLGNRCNWLQGGWGQYRNEDCMLEFHVPEDENPVNSVMIHPRGMGANETLLRLAQRNCWCLVDDSLTPISEP